MSYPIDQPKLDRVRARMGEEDLDALVLRAPDNILYLSNYWCMKGWDVLVFPREGDPTLVSIEPQQDTIERTCWFDDVRLFRGFDPDDGRPPFVRSLDLALQVMHERGLTGRVGAELSHGAQGADRMVGEPTVYTKGYFDALEDAAAELVDASPLMARLRMRKTDQEIERIRRTNRLAADAVAHVRANLDTSMREPDVAAMLEGYVHSHGIGYEGRVDMARAFTLCWSGDGIQTFHATGNNPVREDEPTLMEIWVCADGYWNDLTKNACPGTLSPRYDELLDLLLGIFRDVTTEHVHDGARVADVDAFIRERLAEGGYGGQPSHFVCHGVGARAHEPPWAHPRSDAVLREGMVVAIEPGVYWEGGGGLRLEDNFLITADGCEQLCPAPDDFRRS